MISHTETTVFNVSAQTIVNTVNCAGVMGSGLALEFRLRYPKMFEDYVDRCKQKAVKIGQPYVYRIDESLQILNFPTKNHWRYPSKPEWIERGMRYFAEHHQEMQISSIAFPLLGCSRGNLAWAEVKPIMEKYLQNISYPVLICHDSETDASGIERMMVEAINNPADRTWVYRLHLSAEGSRRIKQALPLRRFREVLAIKGIGKDTYEKLFHYFYAGALYIAAVEQNEGFGATQPAQLGLFD